MNRTAKILLAIACSWIVSAPTSIQAQGVTPKEAREIAKEAYIFGFPMVDNYRVLHSYFIDPSSPEFKGPINQIVNNARVYTPADTAIQTPNSDTPYSYALLDLRAEPMVLTLPAIEENRYYSVQLIDLYTFNFAYLGTRTTGNSGGSFMIAGPKWQGDNPVGITKVIKAATDFVFPAYRTQLFGPDDLENVKKIQAGYKIEPLSTFLNKPAPPPAPAVSWIKPLSPEDERTSPEFFNQLAFIFQFVPVDPEDAADRDNFAKIGVVPGKEINLAALPPEMTAALKGGMEDGQKEIDAVRAKTASAADILGNRELFRGDWVNRAVGAQMGIYGNSKEEASYVVYGVDAAGKPLNAVANNYTLRFAPGQFPPTNAFWSVTMYDLPQQLLVANPLNRYLINSPMLPQLKLDPDKGLTIYIQSASPGPDKESNWLPAPDAAFMVAMRLYYPKESVLNGTWQAPKIEATPK